MTGSLFNHAVQIANIVQEIIQPMGFHVALGGGCLHKVGFRKDVDLIIYSDKTFWKTRNEEPNINNAMWRLRERGFVFPNDYQHQWCNKATYDLDFVCHQIDFLTPEAPHNEYSKDIVVEDAFAAFQPMEVRNE